MSDFVALNLDDYEYVRFVGSGSFSEVTLQRHKKTGDLVAIKRFDLTRADKVYEIDFMKEISILGTLNYPSIIKFYGFSGPGAGDEDDKSLCYAFEFMENGSLDDLLTDIQAGIEHPEFGPTERMTVIYGIALALRYMHHFAVKDGFVMHRDIKSGNVLLDKDLHPRLADFGFAKVISSGMPNTPARGSWPWMAPEVMLGEDYSVKADVYSFGMFMSEVVTGTTPYIYCKNSKEVINAVLIKKQRPELPEPHLPIYDLITMCWDEKPERRPNMMQVCQMLITQTMALPGSDIEKILEYAKETELHSR